MVQVISLPPECKSEKRIQKLTDGEKESGLAAVALTMGEEKVKETETGVDAAFTSCIEENVI